MPHAFENYENYIAYTHRMPYTPPVTPGEPENFYTFSNHDQRAMSTAGLYSPSSMESPNMDTYDDNITLSEVYDTLENPMDGDSQKSLFEPTEIKIVVQPVDKFRFRYRSEMAGTHGSLLGEREKGNHKKEVPTAQLVNCPYKNAVIRCTLVTADPDRRYPHAHHLVRKDGNNLDKDDPHDIEVSDENDYTAMFCNMGIIHTAKKNIKDEILRKKRIEVLEEKKRTDFENPTITTREDLDMKMEAEKAKKWMNLNSVALCFQGFSYGKNNVLIRITDKIYSRPINNLKSALTGELKICRIDKHYSSCEGNDEIWLLVEKVGKKNIKVIFYELDEKDNVIWSAEGRFSELDVHHQYAIVFKTPPYKDTNITETKEVFLKLERPSDGEVSNSIKFKYKASEKTLNRKRRRKSSLSANLDTANLLLPNPQLENCMPLGETFFNLNGKDISDLSGELKKLLSENNQCNSEDMKAFLDNYQNVEEYCHLITPAQSPQLPYGFASDGGGAMETDTLPENFAKDTVRKIMNLLKATDESSSSKSNTLNTVRNLLQELTNYGDTPLHASLRHEQYEIAKVILIILSTDPELESIVNIQNSSGKTPLHLAVLQNQPDIVRALLKLRADPNKSDEEDASALHNAVIVNAIECINEILNSNVKLNLEAHTEAGWSALHLAAKIGSLPAVQALVEAGADVNATDMSYGRTALHIAVDSNHKHIVNYLLSRKVNVNMKNFGGNTALHGAVVKGGKVAEELVKLLKKYGADPNIRNNNVNDDDEDEENSNPPPTRLAVDSSSTPTIKSESSDSDNESSAPGDSSFDLARNDARLMQLLSEERPADPIDEELDLKEESEDEMPLQDRVDMQARLITPTRHKPVQNNSATSTETYKTAEQQRQLEQLRQSEEKLTDEHVNRIKGILDRTGGWERLANHTNHGSLVRLHRKTSSPSTALFVKIRLQQPDITVRQVKKMLIEVQAFDAASALVKK